ncbi:MAG: potassium channel family protein [Desulfarculaceae bacterium]|nr:potassium channel family protein [Desulfarculaceae bacterium]MCF8072479.1 potassium channel family protein [Desulfarculaceae bacterium]MCF8102940.1 potassium channel family protein [Desulfarculaceae bacterium]MCF8117457.1 potassium channel family protein [Desulfarculaceae bacterium]
MDDITFRLRVFLLVMLAVLIVGTVGFTLAENLPLADAVYFSIVTITTVGYGDISPHTVLGKILAVFLIVGGVGTFMGVVANATEMLLSRRERAAQLAKLYVVEGIFFSELGSELLLAIIAGDPRSDGLGEELRLKADWKPADFKHLEAKLAAHEYEVDPDQVDLEGLSNLLRSHNNLLLRLLENPFITEQDSFTECLRAVFHLKDELYHRPRLHPLLPTDRAHLGGDLKRVYQLLVMQWLIYVKHLSQRHPYLFSLAVRLNPFDPERDPVVRS